MLHTCLPDILLEEGSPSKVVCHAVQQLVRAEVQQQEGTASGTGSTCSCSCLQPCTELVHTLTAIPGNSRVALTPGGSRGSSQSPCGSGAGEASAPASALSGASRRAVCGASVTCAHMAHDLHARWELCSCSC